MPDQRDVQQLIQSLTPSAVNNGNPNTVYNQPMPQGGYIPPTFDPGTNTWRVNPAPAAPTVNWQQMAMSQPQSWNWAQPTPPPTPVPPNPGVPGPTTPVPTTPVPSPQVPTTQGPAPPSGIAGRYGNSGDGAEGCVVVESFLSDYDRADEVQVGDTMSVVDPVKRTTSTGKVSYSETKLMPCVRITTETGIVLECSTTAPIADERGEQVLAPNLLNKLIPVVDNGAHYLDRVASIEDIGEKEVRHITVENNFFLAGKEKGRYIYHHNVKMAPGTSVDLFGMMASLNDQFGWSTASNFMDSSSPNTRGAMQANGTWDSRAGGTVSNPATAWGEAQAGGNNYTPTGQGLVDAFGGSTLPTGNAATAPNPWTQPGAVDSWNPNMSWMTPSPADFSGYGPQLNAPPQLQIGEQGSTGGGILNWLDNNLAGNLYDENSGTWNKGNILGSVASAVTGIPINEGVLRMGTNNLIQGGGFGSDYARAQLQQQYDRSNSQQRSEFIQRTAEQYNTTPEKLLEVIGR